MRVCTFALWQRFLRQRHPVTFSLLRQNTLQTLQSKAGFSEWSFHFAVVASSCAPLWVVSLLNWLVTDRVHGHVQSNYILGRKWGWIFPKSVVQELAPMILAGCTVNGDVLLRLVLHPHWMRSLVVRCLLVLFLVLRSVHSKPTLKRVHLETHRWWD